MNTCYVYGGAFNPPTVAHQKILQALVDLAAATDGTEIWIMPSGENNRKKTGIPTEVRIAYCEALIRSISPRGVLVRIERLEIDDTERTDKVETVKRLSERYPLNHFVWVYGSDSLATIDAWGGDWLKAQTDMVIVPRSSAKIENLPERSIVVDAQCADDASSTEIRSRIRDNLPYAHLVPKAIADSIDPSFYRGS